MVKGTGNPNAEIAIVGEQPGEVELRSGLPFIGPAGVALNECLLLAGIARTDCYITNVIKTGRSLDGFFSDGVFSEKGAEQVRLLIEELKALPNLKVVVALGNVALCALTGRTGINKWRGSVLWSEVIGRKVIGTFHPATIIPPKCQWLNKPLIIFDLKRALAESEDASLKPPPIEISVCEDGEDSIKWLETVYLMASERKDVVDLDIEVVKGELDCFAVCWAGISRCIPLGDAVTPEEELEILRWLNRIVSCEDISLRGANIIFDLQFLLNKYGMIPRGEIHCTQIAQKILTPDYPAGLDFVTSLHTPLPYYKGDGKQWLKHGVGSLRTWHLYNATDAAATHLAHPNQLRDLEAQGNMETYDVQRRLILPLMAMTYRGIKVDVEGLFRQKLTEEEELARLCERLNSLVGYAINPNSPKQLCELFYIKLGHTPYKKRTDKGSTISTDIDALKRLARKGVEEAKLVMQIRRLSKRLGTYLDPTSIDPDGRYRSSYKPAGAGTGRISSGKTIFGTGGNQQNWPHDLLRYFVADDGYVLYTFDLSQAENRIVAYVGGITPMIEAFEKGIDLHRLTASLIFGKPIEQISDEPGSCPLGDGTKSERDFGKRANHSLNYDLGYKTFALRYEMPETEAKWIVEQYHRAYPGVRHGYQAMVRHALQETRTLVNCYGRKRVFMGPVKPNPPFVPASAVNETFKDAYAHIPQSTVADKVNRTVEYIYYSDHPLLSRAELLTQIHDSIVIQVPLTLSWLDHAFILKAVKDNLEELIYWHDTPIPIPVDLTVGVNMCKELGVTLKSAKIPTDLRDLCKVLEDAYETAKAKS